jgi:O-acetyl-ADP-ribose deacetylase (regulator of RNase III)
MEYIKGDLLRGDWKYACHVANSHKVMGSGIAYFLKKKWPQVYEADLDCSLSPEGRNGNYSVANIGDGRRVYNLYAMKGIGHDSHPLNRNLRYDDLHDALFKVCDDLLKNNNLDDNIKIAIPYKMGCDRAGGCWDLVHSILDLFEKLFGVTFVIYILEDS